MGESDLAADRERFLARGTKSIENFIVLGPRLRGSEPIAAGHIGSHRCRNSVPRTNYRFA
jgi:hypothetical protein